MLDRKLDLAAPKLKEAYQLGAVLIFTIVAILTPLNIMSGQIVNFAEFIPMVTGLLSAIALCGLPYLALRLAARRPLYVAIPILILTLTLTSIVMTVVDLGWNILILHLLPQARPPAMSLASQVIVASFYWIQYACVMALYWVSSTARQVRVRETELATSQMLALDAELKLLRMQLNPHFMCNSLNVVSSLIMSGQYGDAQRMADKLADFLRASMSVEGMEVELGDELDLIDSYLEVEAARFGSRLGIDVQHNQAIERALVPNFLLQPLVENALKYGVHASRGPVEVRVLSRREGTHLVLSVENEAQGGEMSDIALPPGGGIGLKNVRSRLSLLFGADATLSTEELPNGYKSVIRLPFREMQLRQQAIREPAYHTLQ